MKVGFFITARLKSSRLPEKALLDLNGRNVTERIIDRCKRVKGVDRVVLCTSYNPQDLPLLEIAKKENIYCFTGSEDDVLLRLLRAARLFKLDYIIGITADNPMFSIEHAEALINEVNESNCDYVKYSGLPLGAAPYIMKVAAFEVINRLKEDGETEFWPEYFREELFDIKEIEVSEEYKRPDFRLTIDYPEDYELMKTLYERVNFEEYLSLEDAIKWLDSNPSEASVNSERKQLWLEKGRVSKIDRLFEEKKEEIIRIKERIYSAISD